MHAESAAVFLNSNLQGVNSIRPVIDLRRRSFDFDFVDDGGVHRMVEFRGVTSFTFKPGLEIVDELYNVIIESAECNVSPVGKCYFETSFGEISLEFLDVEVT